MIRGCRMGPEVDILSDLRQEVEDKKLKENGHCPA